MDEAKVPATEGSNVRLKCEKYSTVADKKINDFLKHICFKIRNDKPVCVRPVSLSSEEILATKMDWKTNYLPNYSKIWPETRGESAGFSCFSLFAFCFHTLVFEDFHIKNYGHYFDIVTSFCCILVNLNLTFFDANNFELAIIIHKVYFRILFVLKWTNLTFIVVVNTLLTFWKWNTDLCSSYLSKYGQLFVTYCLL